MIGKAVPVLVLSLLLFVATGFTQARSYQTSYKAFNIEPPVQAAIREELSHDVLYPKLSDFEKDFIYYLNYARLEPKLFAEKAVKPYLAAYPEFKPVYGESLLSLLRQGTVLELLFPSSKLMELARQHAQDISTHDLMSHNSSDGTGMQKRFEQAGLRCGSECINMLSKGAPLEVLLSLLVDYQVQGYGHRRSLLSDKMKAVGVGMRSSRKELQYTVVDLSCD